MTDTKQALIARLQKIVNDGGAGLSAVEKLALRRQVNADPSIRILYKQMVDRKVADEVAAQDAKRRINFSRRGISGVASREDMGLMRAGQSYRDGTGSFVLGEDD